MYHAVLQDARYDSALCNDPFDANFLPRRYLVPPFEPVIMVRILAYWYWSGMQEHID